MLLAGRYRIVRMLGQGGMGRVFLAEDDRLPGKQWAVKELRPGAADREAVANEARFLAECSHPGLAGVTDFIPADAEGNCYLIMEYIQGQTLLQAFRSQSPFPWRLAVRIGIELCQVLAYLHEGRPRPIIHRDLKPSNVMLDQNGRVRLIDFGTARHYNVSASSDTVQLGTPGFAAPEQLMGIQTDARTDLYALGALLFFLLSGGETWNPSRKGAIASHAAWQEVPRELGEVVLQLLEEEPSRRCRNAIEAEALLKKAAGLQKESGSRRQGGEQQEEPDGLRRRIIVVGGLTAGSGTTFTALSLSRLLKERRISHSLVELPGTKPDLYHLLFGEKKAPKGYRYAAERAQEATSGLQGMTAPSWTDGATEWAPLPADRPIGGWIDSHTDRLLQLMSHHVIILDAGSAWPMEWYRELYRQAELVLLVCGPSPVHMSRLEASQTWAKVSKLQQEGTDVRLIANRCVDFRDFRQWLEALPADPLCQIPELPSAEVLSCLWRGELVPDSAALRPAIAASLSPALELICGKLASSTKKPPSTWKRLRQSLGWR